MCLDGTVPGWWWAKYDAALDSYDGAPGTGGGSADGATPSPETFASAGERDSGRSNINTRTNKSKYKNSHFIFNFRRIFF